MKKVRIFTCLMALVLIAASLAGCGSTSAKSASADNSSKQEQNGGQRSFQGGKGNFAKVVSLNGDQLTVVLADRPTGRDEGGTPPAIGSQPGISDQSNSTPQSDSAQSGNNAQGDGPAAQNGAAPSGNAAPPSSGSDSVRASGPALEGASPGAMHQGPDSENQWRAGNGGRAMTFSGENVIYTLSADVTIMKGRGDAATKMDLSELKADDLIRFTTVKDDSGDEKIDSIVVMTR